MLNWLFDPNALHRKVLEQQVKESRPRGCPVYMQELADRMCSEFTRLRNEKWDRDLSAWIERNI